MLYCNDYILYLKKNVLCQKRFSQGAPPIRVFREQLPLKNEFYSETPPNYEKAKEEAKINNKKEFLIDIESEDEETTNFYTKEAYNVDQNIIPETIHHEGDEINEDEWEDDEEYYNFEDEKLDNEKELVKKFIDQEKNVKESENYNEAVEEV